MVGKGQQLRRLTYTRAQPAYNAVAYAVLTGLTFSLHIADPRPPSPASSLPLRG